MGRAANRWATCSGFMVCTSILTVLLSPATSRAATCEPSIAKAMAVEGKVDVRHPDETQWQTVKLHDTFCPGDMIRVQERSRADIALSNQPMLRLDQNTTMTLGGIKKEGGSLIELVKGATHFFSRVPRNLEVRTAFVNAGVEGTEGVIRVTDDKAEVTIFEGKVVAANESGTLNITDGQSVVAEKGKAPSYQTVVKPRDAVQWALHYPPIQDVSPEAAVNENDPRSLTGRAARSLSVGRVDEANADIDRALKLDPKNSDALALQSIIAVVQNDKDKALALAQQAVIADPTSASAKTALSYAQQARFDLDGARKTLEEEVQAHPDNALAWARLAELRASFSELDGALDAAQKAVALNPNLSRTQTVLGFAYLLQVKTKEAQEAFSKAIEFDQADAMPRLGLGLAKFREGKTEEGRREMEVAASLDPNNSMIRSYLGKAYFEEKQDKLTEREYKNAKELDPKDPTPFFYDALQKQLTNRPVEALQDMEKAIELNKNRAVYRSQLQLDSDLAARSASLGRIYSDLGYQQVALVEGWNSITADPTSFTAARFLADSYSVLPRHEVARVSELLRSQLLQPINITPIQPKQAISNLFLLSSLGPGATSFSEFNTLMVNRDRLTVLGSGLFGDNTTSSGEGVVAGIYKNLSFSVGYSNFSTDGWRPNATQRDGNMDAFVQMELSPRTSIQVEYRYRNLQRGDVQQKFWNDNFEPNFMNAQTTNTARIGGRHSFTPNSILLANFTYVKSSEIETFAPPNAPPIDFGGGFIFPVSFSQINGKQYKQDAYTGELQHQLKSQYFNLVTGVGYAQQNGHPFNQVGVDFSSIGGPFNSSCDPNFPNVCQNIPALVRHYNAYGYGYFKILPNLTFISGASYDYVQGSPIFVLGSNSTNQNNSFNPKFGVLYQLTPDTTIRAAAFHTLKRTLTNDQTIEPTQVAGFNQFYDDFNGAEGWRYGAAVNQKFTKTFFGGVEGSYRKMDTPAVSPFDPTVQVTNVGEEYQALGYLFYAPHPWVALKASYSYDQFTNSLPQATVFPSKSYTSRIPLGISFFHPSGLIASVTETYWNQNGDFTQLSTGNVVSGLDTFWLTDVALAYRLPKRYGLITVGINNLFDQNFNFFNIDPRNPLIQPDRFAFFKVTLALP